MINILDVTCSDIGFMVRILAKLLKYLHFIIPIILIVMVIFDFSKVIIGQADDKAKKDATSKMVKRLIYSVIIFLIPNLLFIVFDKINGVDTGNSHSNVSATTWYSCFKEAYNK